MHPSSSLYPIGPKYPSGHSGPQISASVPGRFPSGESRFIWVASSNFVMQGARVILLRPANWTKHSFGPWLTTAATRLHHNVLATALANKLARIAWTVLAQRRHYEARVIAEAA